MSIFPLFYLSLSPKLGLHCCCQLGKNIMDAHHNWTSWWSCCCDECHKIIKHISPLNKQSYHSLLSLIIPSYHHCPSLLVGAFVGDAAYWYISICFSNILTPRQIKSNTIKPICWRTSSQNSLAWSALPSISSCQQSSWHWKSGKHTSADWTSGQFSATYLLNLTRGLLSLVGLPADHVTQTCHYATCPSILGVVVDSHSHHPSPFLHLLHPFLPTWDHLQATLAPIVSPVRTEVWQW